MAKKGNPRHGSMQFWPRKRASRSYPAVHSYQISKDVKPLSFAGYKVGMTHVLVEDTRISRKGKSKGGSMVFPVTILEVPPLKVLGVRLYTKSPYGLSSSTQILAPNLDKELGRKIIMPKKKPVSFESINFDVAKYTDVRLIVYTQPKLTGIGKKKPEVFEVGIGGTVAEKWDYAKSVLGKELVVADVLAAGMIVDVHAVTKGKGFQGPVKRFGVSLRSHKSEKVKRGPGSLGGWKSQGHVMYRVAHAGQMGYHTRTDYNKQVILVGEDVAKINVVGGFKHYGNVKNNYVLVKGSVPGSVKRLVRIVAAVRPRDGVTQKVVPKIHHISTVSSQGK